MRYTEKLKRLKEEAEMRITSQAQDHVHHWRPGDEMTTMNSTGASDPGHSHKIDEENMMAMMAFEHTHRLL